MAEVTASVTLASAYKLDAIGVVKNYASVGLSYVHDLDVITVSVSPGYVAPLYSGYILLRSLDRRTVLSAELGKGSFADFTRAQRIGVFDIAGRSKPVALTGALGSISGQFSLMLYESESSVRTARLLLATGAVLEVPACPEPLLAKSFIAVLGVVEHRLAFADWARKFEVQFVQVDKPK